MDKSVTEIGDIVVAELRAASYMESTILQYQKTIRLLVTFAANRGGVYTPAMGAEFASLTTSPRTGRFSSMRRFGYGRVVRLFDSYFRTGQVDLTVQSRCGGGPQPTCSEFMKLNADWEAEMTERGLASATRTAYGRTARSYLVFLEDLGITRFDAADGASITGFLQSLASKWAKSSLPWVISNFRPFLKFNCRTDLIEVLRLARAKRVHSLLPVLSDTDVNLVIQACRAGTVSARDAAITLFALTAGLRACDLLNLRLSDIDWRSRTAVLVQQKTGNPLSLPLPPLLLEKLIQYILNERPSSSDDHVFLRSLAPHTKLSDHASIYRITADAFRKAGVRDVRAGTRFLRHNAASRLLRAGTALPTISAVLGHADPESTNQYMSVDEQNLLECVLPVPGGRSGQHD